MFCRKCGKEISDDSNFCYNCGMSINHKTESVNDEELDKSKKLNLAEIRVNKKSTNKYLYFLIITIIFLCLCILTTFIFITKTPEYTIYKAVVAMKDNNYIQATKYINIEKITNNRIDNYMEEVRKDESLENNMFAGLAYMIVESLKPKLTSLIQKSFKDVVESPDNIFQQISKPGLLLFLCAKNYNDISLQKTVNEPKKVEFIFNSGNKIKNLHIVLNKTTNSEWEIVDIYGYDFWKDDNNQYLQYDKNNELSGIGQNSNNTRDLLLNRANINYSKFKKKQEEYVFNSWKMSKEEKDLAFKKVYDEYMNGYFDLTDFYYNGDYSLNNNYVNSNINTYNKLGISFNRAEGQYYFEQDYMNLINTIGIPTQWKKWLTLQQKYTVERREECKDTFCEGDTMNADDMEQAIIDLENIEAQSKIIAEIETQHYDYVPYTSKRLIDKYLLGNELSHRFDYSEPAKLYPEYKHSYEHFINTYKKSKYYPLVNSYYEKLQKNNFKYSEETQEWLYKEVEKY